VTNQQIEIIRAIEEELASSSRQRRFKVLSAARQPGIIGIKVQPLAKGDRVESALEGGVAMWRDWSSSVVECRLRKA